MSPPVPPALVVSESAIAALRAHPAFRQACEANATLSNAYYCGCAPEVRWVMKDLGRAAICFTALVLHSLDALTAQALTSVCLQHNVSSAGRVSQMVRRCLETGLMRLEGGEGGRWTRQPLTLTPALLEALRGRAQVEAASVALLNPIGHAIHAALATDDGFFAFSRNVALVMNGRPHQEIFNKSGRTRMFFDREAATPILFDLLASQSPDRSRLLESAPLSRLALSRRFEVSRAHINKVLADAEAEGYLACPTTDRVEFTPALSDAIERQFAVILQGTLVAGSALLARDANAA